MLPSDPGSAVPPPAAKEKDEKQRAEPLVEGVSLWELFHLEHSPDLNLRRRPGGGFVSPAMLISSFVILFFKI